MSNNAHELSNRLLNALDNNYNVVDMHTVNEIISILEKFNITKELLETTRLGKHVNELRRKTTDPTLARRAKVLVKRWRDLVIPTVASPGHTGSNRSSAERNMRRLGGTPLTSPALSLHRQVVSPAVPSPRPPSRPAWGGYESDSQDVILVDDDPPPPPLPPPPAPHKPTTPSVKRPPSPIPLYDEKKAKRDKKPKKRRGHSRAGSGTETASGGVPSAGTAVAGAPPPTAAVAGAPPPTAALAGTPPPAAAVAGTPPPPPATDLWRDRNGTERRRNGCRTDTLDPYTALVNRMPPAGAKKVKTTKELLEEIQSRGVKPPASPASPHSPDVMLIEPDSCDAVKVESPLRNGTSPAARPPSPLPPLEEPRPARECTCGAEGEEDAACGARRAALVLPLHVAALHHAYLPGVNGTRAPRLPPRYAVRQAPHPDTPGLFASVVPLYKYSDYADDGVVKNMSRVPLCTHLPWTEFAPDPPPLPPPPSPPPLRPYPLEPAEPEVKPEPEDEDATDVEEEEEEPPRPPPLPAKVEAEMVGVPCLEPTDRLKAPLLSAEEETQFPARPSPLAAPAPAPMEVEATFEMKPRDHRTVERTKAPALDGRALHAACVAARDAVPYDYAQLGAAPVLTLPEDAGEAEAALGAALEAAADPPRDALGRPLPPPNFTEWHESARLGELIALPYVVID